jgi:hypothetical protein
LFVFVLRSNSMMTSVLRDSLGGNCKVRGQSQVELASDSCMLLQLTTSVVSSLSLFFLGIFVCCCSDGDDCHDVRSARARG